LNGPWELRQIKDLANGDTVRESGSGPHKVAEKGECRPL
jgi:hypothetical protein